MITKKDLEEAQNLLPGRSIAAIKKKYLEIKNQKTKQSTGKWTQAELDELVGAFKNRPEPLPTARIRAICDSFPGRTEKAIAKKLRDNYPGIYYMRNNDQETEGEAVQRSNNDTTPLQQQQPRDERDQNDDEADQLELIDQETQSNSDDQQPEVQATNTTEPSTTLAGPETEGEEGYAQPPTPRANHPEREEPFYQKTKARFSKVLGYTSDKKPKIKRFLIRPQNKKTVSLVDAILEESILEIQSENSKTDVEKRKAIKNAIYVATKILRDLLVTNKPVRQTHKRTQEQICRLRKRISDAREIRNLQGQSLSKRLYKQAKIIKKLKMSIKDYIN